MIWRFSWLSTDPFNKWEAAQRLYKNFILGVYKKLQSGEENLQSPFTSIVTTAFRKLVESDVDGSLKTLALMLPMEAELLQDISLADPSHVHDARNIVKLWLREALLQDMTKGYATLTGQLEKKPYVVDKDGVACRSLRNTFLSYITASKDKEAAKIAFDHYDKATNMTDKLAGIRCLMDIPSTERDAAIKSFYTDAKGQRLIIDKWFSLHARADHEGVMDDVLRLLGHEEFTYKNPNRMRSLIFVFALNVNHFHNKDGRGYKLLADTVIEVDRFNPSIAARGALYLINWKSVEPKRQALMKAELERILSKPGISNETYEIVSKALK